MLWYKGDGKLYDDGMGQKITYVQAVNADDIAGLTVKCQIPFEIKEVIFNNPATVVLWTDGTKTVVKVSAEEEFDPEKGLAMAIAKKALGNSGNYFNIIKKYTSNYERN